MKYFLFLLTLLFFLPYLITSQTFFFGDVLILHFPWREYASLMLKEGKIPLWNPYNLCGHPFIAHMQPSFFYPLTIIFYLFSFPKAIIYNAIIHIFLAGFFMYRYAKVLNLDKFSALFSAIVFMFSGVIIHSVEPVPMGNIMVWTPLLFLLSEKAIIRKNYFYTFLFTLVLGFVFFGGHDLIIYLLAAIILYSLYNLILRKDIKKILRIFLFVILGILLASIQIIPSFEFAKFSTRAGIRSYEQFAEGSTSPYGLINFFLPYLFGNPAEGTTWSKGEYLGGAFNAYNGYLGILPLFLTFLTIIFLRNKYFYFYIFLALFSLLFSLGSYTPFHKLFFYLPGAKLFGGPYKSLFLYTFSISILSGFGYKLLTSDLKKINKNILFKIFKILIFINIILFLFFLFYLLDKSFFLNLGNKVIQYKFYNLGRGKVYPLEFWLSLTNSIYGIILRSLFIFIIVFTLNLTSLFLLVKKEKYIWKISLIFLLIIDLFLFGFNKSFRTITPEIYTKKPETLNFLEKDKSIYRVLGVDSNRVYWHYTLEMTLLRSKNKEGIFINNPKKLFKILALLPSYYNMNFKIYKLEGYGSIRVLWVAELQDSLKLEKDYNSPLLNLLNVKYILTDKELNKFNYKFTTSSGIKLYENKIFLPRAFICYEKEILKDKEKIIQELKKGNFNLLRIQS